MSNPYFTDWRISQITKVAYFTKGLIRSG